jgi:hypothetical protein
MPVAMRGGKEYATVNERLEQSHGEKARPKGITSVVTEVRPAGQVTVILARVRFEDGREFTGMSEIKFDATSGADKDAPVECAETSAVGRALAFAGYYGSDDGLAGAEEVAGAERRATQRGSWPQNGQGHSRPAQPAPTRPVARPSGPPDVATLRQRYDHWRGLALTVGLDDVPPAPEGADANQLTDLGIALRERVDEARKAKGGQP